MCVNSQSCQSTTARRLYLFQRPLDRLGSISTRSSSIQTGPGAELNETDHRIETLLPRISDHFQLPYHIGAIVVNESVCADTTLPAARKLATGIIYEHAGPEMRSSRGAVGVAANEIVVASFTALEFIGPTRMTNFQLDVILQELLRADRNLDGAPPYHSLYWNCHDIATRFALLTTSDNDNMLSALAILLERGKLDAKQLQDFGISSAGIVFSGLASALTLSSLLPAAAGGIITLPVTATVGAGVVAVKARWAVPVAFQIYQQNVSDREAVIARCNYLEALEIRFPRLRVLGLGRERWQEIAEVMGSWAQQILPVVRALLL
ncbi:hypothetical protein BDV11DRAFT_73711 [Aspergillus similis]